MKFTFAGYDISIEKLVEELKEEFNQPQPAPKARKEKKPRKQKCMYREKVCYTREEAAEAVMHIKNPQIRIYCCEFCNTWHLTHKKLNVRRR